MTRLNLTRFALLGVLALLLAQTSLAGEIDGTWHFIFSTDENDYPREVLIAVNGDQATAKMGEETFKGTFKDGKLKLDGNHYADEAGYTAEFKINGKLADGKLAGTATWDTYDLTFTATRK